VRIDAIGDATQLDMALDDPSPERQTASRQDLKLALATHQRDAPKRREAFMLRKLEGLSQREIARRMGISESTVEKTHRHALHRLMDAMKGARARWGNPTAIALST
jgi:RNA polymerase sigma-70 factor (ECF subfamily)